MVADAKSSTYRTATTLAETDSLIGLATPATTPDNIQVPISLVRAVLGQRVVEDVAATTYTPVAADVDKLKRLNHASPITLTLPRDSDVTLPIGTEIGFKQLGAGQITIVAGTSPAAIFPTDLIKSRARDSEFLVRKESANTWYLVGDLSDGYGQEEEIEIPLMGDETTDLATSSNYYTRKFRFNFHVVAVKLFCTTAGTGSTWSVDVKDDTVSIFSTLPTVDASETDSDTAATAAVITGADIASGSTVVISGTTTSGTKPKGAKATLVGRRY